MPDIRQRADLDRLVAAFYETALHDDVLGPVFVAAGTDLVVHLPVIASFWERILLGTGSYDGRVMAVHRRVHEHAPLAVGHFVRWLSLWEQTVRRSFDGPVAERAIDRARHMGAVMLRDVQRAPEHRTVLPVLGR